MNRFARLLAATFYTLLVGIVPALPQAALLPNAKQTFVDQNGKPLTGGKVYNYVPSTTVPKTTWSDSGQTTPNTNPVTLDSAGRAVIYGQGSYQQKLTDSAGNLIWNAPTTAWNSSAPTGSNGTDTAPVGTIMPFAGLVTPVNWQWSAGQAISRTDFSDLYSAITVSDATISCVSGSPALAGWPDTSQIRVGAPVESTCLPPLSTVVSVDSASAITVSNNATATTVTTATVFPWGNGDAATTFNVPDMRGVIPAGADALGGSSANRLQTTTTINTVSGSPIIVVPTNNGLTAGMIVKSINVPVGTTVSTVVGTHVTLSANATGTASSTAATFTSFAGANAPGASGGSLGHALIQTELSNALGTGVSTVTDPGHSHTLRGNGAAPTTSDPTNNFLAAAALYRATGSIAMGATNTNTTGITVATSISNNVTATTTISTTSGSPTATVASASGLFVGMTISSTNVPGSTPLPGTTTILTVSGTTITMSANATATAGGVAATFTSTAGGAQHSVLAPTITVNYIVKVKPNSTGAGGVVSIGGMFGDILCGANITCSGDTISFAGTPLLPLQNIYVGDATGQAIAVPMSGMTSITSLGQVALTTAAFSNPSVPIGLTQINGTSVTAMRSDAAQALDQSITPTWTGLHTFNLTPVWPVQTANTVWAGPTSGIATTPAFRILDIADVPKGTAGYAVIGNGASASSFQGFLYPGSGALSRTWQSKVADSGLNVLDFGADPTGVADSLAAFQAAINATTDAKLVAIHVPVGTYKGDMQYLNVGTRAISWRVDGPVVWTNSQPPGTLLWDRYLTSSTRPWTVDNGVEASGATTTTLSTSNGSPTATVTSASGLAINMSIVASNVPAGTYITNIVGTTLTLSNNATATTNQSATFYALAGGGGGIGWGSTPQGNITGSGSILPLIRLQRDARFHCITSCATNNELLSIALNINTNDSTYNDVNDSEAMINAVITEARHGSTASNNQRFVGANIYTQKDITALVTAGTGANDTLFGANIMCEDRTKLSADNSTGTCIGTEFDLHASGPEGASVHRRVIVDIVGQTYSKTTDGTGDDGHIYTALRARPAESSSITNCGAGSSACQMILDNAFVIDPGGLGQITTGINILDGTGATPHLTTAINIASGVTGLQIADGVAGMSTGIYVGTGGIQGPTGGTFNVKSSLPVTVTTSTAGNALTLASSNARAGSSVAGAAAGGQINITAGDAKRLSSGNANGGNAVITAGAGIGTGVGGDVRLNSAGTDYYGLSGNGGHFHVFGGTAPGLSSCGSSPAISGTDIAGQVTMGTATPAGCVITFATAFANAPWCVVSWQANLASMQYTISTTAITLVQTATSSNKVNYFCSGH